MNTLCSAIAIIVTDLLYYSPSAWIVTTEGATDTIRKDFLGEAHMLAQFKHANVMGLLGVVTMSEPIMVILHYMPCGDLKTYLRR